MNPVYTKLEFFRKLITDFVGHDHVEYMNGDQIYQRSFKHPWIALECLRTVEDSTIDGYTEDSDTNEEIPTVTVRVGLSVNVHVRFRDISSFEALNTALRLQGLFSNANFVTGLDVVGLSVRSVDAQDESLESVNMDTVEYDKRQEADYWFPIVLVFGEYFEFKQLTPGWFNAVLLSTEIDGLSELDLDDERIEAQ